MPDIDPRSLIAPPPDVAIRMMLERLERRGPIYKVTRFLRNGPLCPACVIWIQTRSEPGEPNNRMERSQHLAGYISGQPADPRRIYMADSAGTREISRTEYARLLDRIDDALRQNRYCAEASPFDPVRVDAIEIPFL